MSPSRTFSRVRLSRRGTLCPGESAAIKGRDAEARTSRPGIAAAFSGPPISPARMWRYKARGARAVWEIREA
jgi:hypothetical protein